MEAFEVQIPAAAMRGFQDLASPIKFHEGGLNFNDCLDTLLLAAKVITKFLELGLVPAH